MSGGKVKKERKEVADVYMAYFYAEKREIISYAFFFRLDRLLKFVLLEY